MGKYHFVFVDDNVKINCKKTELIFRHCRVDYAIFNLSQDVLDHIDGMAAGLAEGDRVVLISDYDLHYNGPVETRNGLGIFREINKKPYAGKVIKILASSNKMGDEMEEYEKSTGDSKVVTLYDYQLEARERGEEVFLTGKPMSDLPHVKRILEEVHGISWSEVVRNEERAGPAEEAKEGEAIEASGATEGGGAGGPGVDHAEVTIEDRNRFAEREDGRRARAAGRRSWCCC